MPLVKVCLVSDIEIEKPKKFTIQNENILIAKSSDKKIWAFESKCTHADKSLELGKWNPETTEITCPFHKAVFDISDNGAVKSAPAFVSLPVYLVEIKKENEEEFVFIEMD